MSKQELQKLHLLSVAIGDFIRYWGFRKIHGEIWTVLYTSKTPLSGIELTQILDVSKALVSPALKELEDEGLILQTESENSKTKRYQAAENVTEIIRGVLRRRERPMMEQVLAKFNAVNDSSATSSHLNQARVEKLGTLIQAAHLSLLALVETDEIWK